MSSFHRSLLARPEERPALKDAKPDVDEVADQADEHYCRVHLGQLVRDLLPLHVRPDAARPVRNSAVTHTSRAIAALTRMPMAILGREAGNVTRNSLPAGPTPAVLATSWSIGSPPRTPYSVLMRIGHVAAYTTRKRIVGRPSPNHRIASGMSATPGMGRRNSITTDVASRSVREAADEEACTDPDHDRQRETLEVRRERLADFVGQCAPRPQLVD